MAALGMGLIFWLVYFHSRLIPLSERTQGTQAGPSRQAR
jgi:hypothetical protein